MIEKITIELEHKVLQAQQVLKVHKESRVYKVQEGLMEPMAKMEHKVQKVHVVQ
jgi:hypothetical protein